MLTKTNTSLSNLVILATLSSSVVSFSHEADDLSTPQLKPEIENYMEISDWRDKAFNQSYDYNLHDKDVDKLNTMISFTKNLLENSTDIESEFVDIVNENFWDLI